MLILVVISSENSPVQQRIYHYARCGRTVAKEWALMLYSMSSNPRIVHDLLSRVYTAGDAKFI